jgi:NADH dehydrogenase
VENNKNILILGGGYAGIAAAKKLAKHYKKRNDVHITLIDKHPFHTLMTELHEVAGHRVEPDSVRVPFAKIFGVSNVHVELDTIENIDFETNTVSSAEKSYGYDYLVLGSGAEAEYFGVSGVKEHAFSLWSFDDAMKIRHHIDDIFEKAIAEQNPHKRKAMLTFVVAGAGFTGIEMAGELIEWRDVMCEKWLVEKSEVRIIVVEAMSDILPIFEEDLRNKIQAYMIKNGCEIMTSAPITGAQTGKVVIKDNETIETETFIWTAGVSGSNFAESLDLSKGPFGKNPADPNAKNRRGRLLASGDMRSIDYENVFLAGDNIWFLEDNKPLPQIVETALQTAETAAYNIAADIDGKRGKNFKSNYHGFMVSVGGKYAVSNAMNIRMSGFFAIAMKHLVNLHYLIGIAGINQCWEYIKHEFLDMQNNRSLLRGFGAYKTRGYWLLPLRLWLGLMWIMEGVNKIGQGWFSWKTGTKSSWMFSPGVTQNTLAAASKTGDADFIFETAGEFNADTGFVFDTAGEFASDADFVFETAGEFANGTELMFDTAGEAADMIFDTATAATNAAAEVVSSASESVAEIATSASGTVADAVSSASGAAGDAANTVGSFFGDVWDLTKPIFSPSGIVATWFRTTFMDNMIAYVPFEMFQLIVVLAEIGIGLALFGGLFTWWAAAASIVMCLVFTLSGMFAWNQVWFIFAAFLMLGGAGRAFGLDCWVSPFFKKKWNGTLFARKRYFYLDNPSKK